MFNIANLPTSSIIYAGDSFTTNEGPFTITAKIEHDDICRPEDFDCYSDEHKAAWESDEWFFGGLILTVAFDGILIDTPPRSLWGLEVNLNNDNAYLFECANNLIPEVLDDAKARLREIKAKLALLDI